MSSLNQLSEFAARLRRSIHVFERALPLAADREPAPESPAAAQAADRSFEDAEFADLAIELFALQFDHNPPYRRLCEARGAPPAKVRHWTQVPAMPAAAFKELEVSCLPEEDRPAEFHSSGTTGQRPSYHYHNAQSLALYEASLWPWFAANVLARPFPIRDCDLVILGPPRPQAPHSSLIHMFESIRQKLHSPPSVFLGQTTASGAWTLDVEAAAAALRRPVETHRPLVVLGTAFMFVHLLDYLAGQELHFDLPRGSRALETGGYKGRSRNLPEGELHALMTQKLGLPPALVVGEYGMSELSSQAYDTQSGGHASGGQELAGARPGALRAGGPTTRCFRFPPWARAQVISPETGLEVAEGETGLIRVFDLANTYSVQAIQTEDLGRRRGAGFELLGRPALAEPRGCSLMAASS